MPKVREGTRDLPGNIKTRESGRQFRCGCGGMAKPQPDGKGGIELRCPFCKAVYKSTPM